MDWDMEKFLSVLQAGHLVLALVGCLVVFWAIAKFLSSPPPVRENKRKSGNVRRTNLTLVGKK